MPTSGWPPIHQPDHDLDGQHLAACQAQRNPYRTPGWMSSVYSLDGSREQMTAQVVAPGRPGGRQWLAAFAIRLPADDSRF
jgi:hypothetical protein